MSNDTAEQLAMRQERQKQIREEPPPTGLDYHAAFRAMYPGLVGTSVRIHEINDAALKVVNRAARLRRAERERVKAAVEHLATSFEEEGVDFALCQRIRQTLEEIR